MSTTYLVLDKVPCVNGWMCVCGGVVGVCVYYTTSPAANQLPSEPRRRAGDLPQRSRMAPAGQASPLSEVRRLQGKPVTRLCPESAANSFQNLRKEGYKKENTKFFSMCPFFIFFPISEPHLGARGVLVLRLKSKPALPLLAVWS